MDLKTLAKINTAIDTFFASNPSVAKIQAKMLMPCFIKAGVFRANNREGLPIRKVLIALDDVNKLDLIPTAFASRKDKQVNWYFVRPVAD